MMRSLLSLSLLVAVGCGGSTPPAQNPAPAPAKPQAGAPSTPDALGPRPLPGKPAAFLPRTPKTSTQEKLAFWVDERHVLPEVSLAIVLPHGSATDPRGRNGLAAFTGRMLEQGAGARSSVALAKAFESLGAQFSVEVYTDYTTLTLVVLSDKLDAAFALLADVLTKPRLLPADFARERERWKDELAASEKDPRSLFERNLLPLYFGISHPYGHARSGDHEGATKTTLADVKAFYAQHYIAAGATVVAVGDITPEAASKLVTTHLGAWQKSEPKALGLRGTSKRENAPLDPKTVYLLDRPGAPQSVVGFVADGVKSGDPSTPILGRVNAVLGGSFSSRLNQDLREERGITYGASSRFSWHADGGVFVANAAVVADKTGEGMRALDDDIAKYAKEGPTDEESERSRLLTRSDLVSTFESAASTVARLARNAGVGLPADLESSSSLARDKATRADLTMLARKAFGAGARRFVVGPKDVVTPQLVQAGYRVEAFVSPSAAPVAPPTSSNKK